MSNHPEWTAFEREYELAAARGWNRGFVAGVLTSIIAWLLGWLLMGGTPRW